MSTSLATIGVDLGAQDKNEIAAATARVLELAELKDADLLNDVRHRAEASALYEKRAKNLERERHFGKMRLLAEAGLGIISLDSGSSEGAEKEWRTLAAGLERGVLWSCTSDGTSARVVANEIRRRGYTSAPAKSLPRDFGLGGPSGSSITWWAARKIAKKHGIDLTSIPPDPRRIEKANHNRSKAHLQRSVELDRYREGLRRRRIIEAGKNYPNISNAYGYMRQLLDELDKPMLELDRNQRAALVKAHEHLHAAEDQIALALRLG